VDEPGPPRRRGLVTDAVTGQPLDATVDVAEIGKIVRTDPDVGDYHRLLLPGTWTLLCHAEGYLDQIWTVQVISGTATVQDCTLCPDLPLVAAADSEVTGQPGETVTHTFAITNVGPVTASYDLSLTLGDWPAALLDAHLGPLARKRRARRGGGDDPRHARKRKLGGQRSLDCAGEFGQYFLRSRGAGHHKRRGRSGCGAGR